MGSVVKTGLRLFSFRFGPVATDIKSCCQEILVGLGFYSFAGSFLCLYQ